MESLTELFKKIEELAFIKDGFSNFTNKIGAKIKKTGIFNNIINIHTFDNTKEKGEIEFTRNSILNNVLNNILNNAVNKSFSKINKALKKDTKNDNTNVLQNNLNLFNSENFLNNENFSFDYKNFETTKFEEYKNIFQSGFSPNINVLNKTINKENNQSDFLNQKTNFIQNNLNTNDNFNEFGERLASVLKETFINKDKASGYFS